MVILGIDPGIARVGWALIKKHSSSRIETLDFGCFETDKDTQEDIRLTEIYAHINNLIVTYKPDCAAIEKLFFASNAKTAFTVGQARGCIVLACGNNRLSSYSYTPLQIKLAITGYGKADKQQIQRMVQSILHLVSVPKPDDAADALAVSITHAFSKTYTK